ncbi:MAG: GAF domain-containing sensor histidine kinase [Candidatus Limnocylindrales bacterium]
MTADSHRPRRIGVWLLTAVAVLLSAAFATWRAAGASDGVAIPFYAEAWTEGGVRIEVAREDAGGLASGDLVTAVGGRPLRGWLDAVLDPSLDRSPLGPPEVAYTVRRGAAEFVVDVPLGPLDIGPTLLEFWSVIVFTIVIQLVGVYVLWRRPAASAAVALAVAAVGVTGSTLPWLLGLEVIDIARGWPFLLYAFTAGGLYMLLWPAGALHLPLAISAGPAGPRRRSLVLAYGVPLGAYGLGLVIALALAPSSLAWMGTWSALQLSVIVPTVLVGLAMSLRGYRRATLAARRQARGAVLGGVVAIVPSLVLILIPQLATGRPLIPWSAVGLLALPLPLGIAAGIVRDRLFDIETAINRTLVYTGATASLVAIYAIAVTALGAFLRGQGGFTASLLATGLAAVVALPIRDRLQRVVDRLMYGDRDDPYRAIARLGQRLEATLDPIEAPEIIVRTVAESLRLSWVAIKVDLPSAKERLISHGRQPPGQPTVVPLVYGAEIVGELLVSARSPGESLSAADQKLLAALARQAGVAVRAYRLTVDLLESRERLVAAREEERRRIRRDLHDGLGPSLAAIGMRAEVAADLVSKDPATAQQMLADLHVQVQEALGDIRRLVDALRPPALDELGLVGALRAGADRLGMDPAIRVDAPDPLPDLPAAVEVAAYRIALEAMTNVTRHAEATVCRVHLTATTATGDTGRMLEISVTDDGRGLPATLRPGIGLASMRERAAEVGGTCEIGSGPGSGTRVIARLPIDGVDAEHQDRERD